MLPSYSSPFALGHKALENLWDGVVYVSEKVDGSSVSFGIDIDGNVLARSRKQEIYAGPGMFEPAMETITRLANEGKLVPGWIYRGEFLSKPKHNTLCYERVPKGYIILYDIDRGDQDYLNPEELFLESIKMGIECVPTLSIYNGKPSLETLEELLEDESILGGVKVEGIVLKNYGRWGQDKKTLMGKLVRADFKEKHDGVWKNKYPNKKDVVQDVIDTYATEARWQKAVQHLSEQGEIEGIPQDIPFIMREITDDVLSECGDEIKEALLEHFWKDISRGLTRGMAIWYKALIASKDFDTGEGEYDGIS